MKVMYIAPRYHTNQIPIVKGWIEHGDEVCFVSRCSGPIEDYSTLRPIEVPYSKLSNAITNIYMFFNKNNPYAADFSLKSGFPNINKIKKVITSFEPDLVILREKSVYSMICAIICKKNSIKAVTYNQSPLYDFPEKFDRDFKHRLIDNLMPKKRLTPVRVSDYNYFGKVADDNAFFAPFICELRCTPMEKKYFLNGNINILDVGRFEKRKNHLLMLDAFSKILKEYGNVKLTIVGEVSDKFHEEYLGEVRKYIHELSLKDYVKIYTNQDVNKMEGFYSEADLYVLPSSDEPAAVSILEAFGWSLPVICSTTNGTADYVKEGQNGYVFESGDVESLKKAIIKVIKNKEKLVEMGERSYIIASQEYQFCNYYDALMNNV